MVLGFAIAGGIIGIALIGYAVIKAFAQKAARVPMDLGGVRNLRSYFCPAIHSPERDSHDCQVADLVKPLQSQRAGGAGDSKR